MSETMAQTFQKELDQQLLHALNLAAQIEKKRYSNIPSEDLSIEVRTLFRAQEKLAWIVQGLSKGEYLLVHEWQAILIAAKHELARYDGWPQEQIPTWIQELGVGACKVMKMVKWVNE